jgi:ABC-2 type transport system permease protein
MSLALHAEWTKFRTVAGPAWLLAGIVAVTVAVGVAAASAARCQSAGCGIGQLIPAICRG